MSTQIRIWEIEGDRVTAVEDTSRVSSHFEADLETWIVQRPDILGENLLVIDRQRYVEGVGQLDLLCIDESGELVIVELKRDLSPREAVAQVLDYTAWLDRATEDQIGSFAAEFLERPVEEAFFEHFNTDFPGVVCQKHRIILVASRLEAGAERILNYLSERYGVDINGVFFKYAKLSIGKEILVCSVLVADEAGPRTGRSRRPTLSELLALAESANTVSLVEICRQMNNYCNEERARTYGGSFRDWSRTPGGKWRMVCGINIAGGLRNAPAGALDVWIPVKSLAEAIGVQERAIREKLGTGQPILDSGAVDCIIRLKTTSEAERLTEQLKTWASSSQAGANNLR